MIDNNFKDFEITENGQIKFEMEEEQLINLHPLFIKVSAQGGEYYITNEFSFTS